MRCLSPRTVGFKTDGKTLAWSIRQHNKEYATFQLPCSKCIACRLETARQTAVRCMHEASLHSKNSFITLTYDDEHLGDSRLRYRDFQLFIKRLREEIRNGTPDYKKETHSISVFVTGEYGSKRKRPHWHALIFNWRPTDGTHKYTNARGDKVFSSANLDSLWANGIAEYGSVTFESASYCARYAAKKLTHGKDATHNFNPISKRSTGQAIGKRWIEKYWSDVFTDGYLVIKNKNKYIQCGVPRYYEKWLTKHKPTEWKRYVTEVKTKIMKEAQEKEEKISLEEKKENFKRAAQMGLQYTQVMTRKKSEKIILEQKFQQLNKYQKDL